MLVLAAVTSMARQGSGVARPGGGRQAGSRGKPTSAGWWPRFEEDVRRLGGPRLTACQSWVKVAKGASSVQMTLRALVILECREPFIG